MDEKLQDILFYWRSSLIDSTLETGQLKQKDISEGKYIILPRVRFNSGILADTEVEQVFRDVKTDIKAVDVIIWPMVTSRKTSHGVAIDYGQPELVAPIVIRATVSRSGEIVPSQNVIARDLLTPLANDVFSIGVSDEFDRFYSKNPLPSPVLPEYIDHSYRMVNEVAPGWPQEYPDYSQVKYGLLKVSDGSSTVIRQIIKLYDTLLHDKPKTPLLEKFACPPSGTSELSEEIEKNFVNRLGHSTHKFPLADHQRQALSYLSKLPPGDVLAVNGPPGTGKTTMLLSAIADAWVLAAKNRDEHPPIIVAASTNNQAVTNIIDAFGKDYAEGKGPFAGRWLPNLKSYGLYLVAKQKDKVKEKEIAQKYQTEDFYSNEIETREYVECAEKAYIRAGQKAFPEINSPTVKRIVERLHEEIEQEFEKLKNIESARSQLEDSKAKAQKVLGDDPEAKLMQLKKVAVKAVAAYDRHNKWDTAWARHQASESTLLAIFSFLPPVARKRAAMARLALQDMGCTLEFGHKFSVPAIGTSLRVKNRAAGEQSRETLAKMQEGQLVWEDLEEAKQVWMQARDQLGNPSPDLDKPEELNEEQFADVTSRFNLFRLACHYWEGRWLIEMGKDLDRIVSRTKNGNLKMGRKDVMERWGRYMMLMPCAVSTFAMLPQKMSYNPGQNAAGEWGESKYLLDFIDLLIVDEAGQVLPEVAAPSFALAKRSLVIGDTQQIEPISSVSVQVDIGNLLERDLLPKKYTEADLEKVSNRGLRSTDGSVMRLAQEACPYEPYKDKGLEKGFYLFEHRRCYDEIIGYCNELCYNRSLQPKRIPSNPNKDAKFPALGYLHIDGMAQSFGGSRANKTEAETIVDWLVSMRDKLESQYKREKLKLEDIVGIVTPFGRQAQEIKTACGNRGIDKKKITVGTVHSLQGAERPIIIFSPVYSKHSDGGFIDRSRSMLNVTVSRAKDSFLVFGDMDVLSSAAKGTPRKILADYLFSETAQSLEYEIKPRTDLILKIQDSYNILSDSAKHDSFLLDAIQSAGRKFTIVSPWVISSTMRKARLLDCFREAVGRGAEIDVFVDPVLSQKHIENAKSTLADIGVCVHEVNQLHSKIFIADSSLLCIGSYNWLSADRQGHYARHETSIVYRGSHLKDEIQIILNSLSRREQ